MRILSDEQKKNISIYQSDDGAIEIDVQLEKEDLWLSLGQMVELFGRDKSVISKHLSNIFANEELDEDSTVAFFATVQNEGGRKVTRSVRYFNLDVILAIGYRVNSKQGIKFRKWATKVLSDHLVDGYSVNNKVTQSKLNKLREIIDIFCKNSADKTSICNTDDEILDTINKYSKTWSMLLEYDENNLKNKIHDLGSLLELNYEEAQNAVLFLKKGLIHKGEASELFGKERDNMFNTILYNILQTFDSVPLYNSNIDRASHLLYCIIKDHPFLDGNKRIGCFLFKLFLQKMSYNLGENYNIDQNALATIALLIAQSNPNDKDIMIKLIMRIVSP